MEQLILSKFLLNLAGCCNILLNQNFAAEIVGQMQERQFFLSSIAICNASDDIQVFNEMFVSYMYTVVSPLRFPGPEFAMSSFSVYIFCAKTHFHLRKSQSPSWKPGGNRDREASGSNPTCFTHLHRNFRIASGMSEHSFCIFRRIHV